MKKAWESRGGRGLPCFPYFRDLLEGVDFRHLAHPLEEGEGREGLLLDLRLELPDGGDVGLGVGVRVIGDGALPATGETADPGDMVPAVMAGSHQKVLLGNGVVGLVAGIFLGHLETDTHLTSPKEGGWVLGISSSPPKVPFHE